jgi:peptide-methionine (S)-S-oxide reductase
MENNKNTETITLAGGCFWCTEAVLKRLKGIVKLQSGYTGGKISNPTYREVCSGLTGHAEAVLVEFDPDQIALDVLLSVFFTTHDPTTMNRQGADIGTQYRSAVYYHSEAQKNAVLAFIAGLEKDGVFESKIVTEVRPATVFYPAEDYHQNYYDQNREQNSYCTAVIDPKVNKLRKTFAHLLSA